MGVFSWNLHVHPLRFPLQRLFQERAPIRCRSTVGRSRRSGERKPHGGKASPSSRSPGLVRASGALGDAACYAALARACRAFVAVPAYALRE